MKWHWVYDGAWRNEAEWKSHAIPDAIFTPIMDSLHERGFLHYDVEEIVDYMTFDLPGMAFVDREEMSIEVDGLTLVIPCCDWQYIHAKLSQLKVRTDAAVPYYKLHGFHRCLVLTPEQRYTMLQQMSAKMAEASAYADVEARRFNEAFAGSDMAAVADGPDDIEGAYERAKAEGKQPRVVVARRPVKDDIGKA